MPRCRCKLAELGLECGTGDSGCEGLPGVHIVKSHAERQPEAYEALLRARADAGEAVPILAHRRDGCHWLAVLEWRDLAPILSTWAQTQRNLAKGRRRAHEAMRRERASEDERLRNFWQSCLRAGYDRGEILPAYATRYDADLAAIKRRARRLGLQWNG